MCNFRKFQVMAKLHIAHFALLLFDQVSSSKRIVREYCSTPRSCRVGAGGVLSWVGFLETCSSVPRGAGGGEGLGRPLMSPTARSLATPSLGLRSHPPPTQL